ncbi:MAG: AI-2E family transporter [Caldilineaceae bacterium]
MQAGYQEFNFIPSLADVLNYIQQVIITTTNVVSTTAFISFSVVGGIFQLFITILIVFFLSLYLTKDAPAIRAYVASLFPSSYQSEVVDLFRRVGFIWSSFFRGQIILSFVVGFVTYIVLSAVGMPGALLLAILAGFLEVIPNLGPTIAMIPAVVVALIQGSPVLTPLGINNLGFALIVIAIYFIIQQLENNILVPRIIGSSVNLHPIVVICGVAVGFNIFGILGALLAAPTIASMRVLGSYIHAKLLGYEPFLDQRPPPRRQRRMTYRRTVTGDDPQRRPVRCRRSRARRL